jgi:hypothetical protein
MASAGRFRVKRSTSCGGWRGEEQKRRRDDDPVELDHSYRS